jgi:hypothetical protein
VGTSLIKDDFISDLHPTYCTAVPEKSNLNHRSTEVDNNSEPLRG